MSKVIVDREAKGHKAQLATISTAKPGTHQKRKRLTLDDHIARIKAGEKAKAESILERKLVQYSRVSVGHKATPHMLALVNVVEDVFEDGGMDASLVAKVIKDAEEIRALVLSDMRLPEGSKRCGGEHTGDLLFLPNVKVDKGYLRRADQFVRYAARYYAKEQAWDRGLENANEARA